MTNTLRIPEHARYLVAGAGQQGTTHLKKLIQHGVQPGDITMVDIDGKKLEMVSGIANGVRTSTDLQQALTDGKYDIGLVMTNTPDHLPTMLRMYEADIHDLFSEKPLISAEQLSAQADDVKTLKDEVRPITAYLMNFSAATNHILDMMNKEKLHIAHATTSWSKNRTGNGRPTLGDLQDELTHPLSLVRRLISHNQTVTNTHVKAMLAYQPFVDMAVQAEAHKRDHSYPLHPNSSTGMLVNLQIRGENEPVHIHNVSSFVDGQQDRQIRLTMADAHGKLVRACIVDFDTPEGDRLKIYDLSQPNAAPRISTQKTDKVGNNLFAYLHAVATSEWDPRLVPVDEAIHSIRMHLAAMEDSQHPGTRI